MPPPGAPTDSDEESDYQRRNREIANTITNWWNGVANSDGPSDGWGDRTNDQLPEVTDRNSNGPPPDDPPPGDRDGATATLTTVFGQELIGNQTGDPIQSIEQALVMADVQFQATRLNYGSDTGINLTDSRWPSDRGWVKMQESGATASGTLWTAHWVTNPNSGATGDFKFTRWQPRSASAGE